MSQSFIALTTLPDAATWLRDRAHVHVLPLPVWSVAPAEAPWALRLVAELEAAVGARDVRRHAAAPSAARCVVPGLQPRAAAEQVARPPVAAVDVGRRRAARGPVARAERRPEPAGPARVAPLAARHDWPVPSHARRGVPPVGSGIALPAVRRARGFQV